MSELNAHNTLISLMSVGEDPKAPRGSGDVKQKLSFLFIMRHGSVG